jgi:hypothetical protein
MHCEDINPLVLYVEQQTVIHTHSDPYTYTVLCSKNQHNHSAAQIGAKAAYHSMIHMPEQCDSNILNSVEAGVEAKRDYQSLITTHSD